MAEVDGAGPSAMVVESDSVGLQRLGATCKRGRPDGQLSQHL